MKKHFSSSRVWGLSMAALLLAVGACSDDDDDSSDGQGGSSGSAGSGGMNVGGSKAGSSGTAGSKSPTAGATQGGGGSAGAAPMPAGGEGGSLGDAGGGGAGGDPGGAGGDPGGAGDTSSAGAGGAGQAGSGAGQTGSGGEGGASNPDGCEYTETNSDQYEETGLTASDVVQTICGNVNNGDYEPVEELVDYDGFEVAVAAGSDALIKLELSDPQALVGVVVYVDNFPTYTVGGRAVIRHRDDDDDLTEIVVRAFNGQDIAAPVPYKLSVVIDDVDDRCPASASAATFTEANDGAGSRDNDVYQFGGNYVASFTDASDAAEPTAITVAAAPQSYRVNGESAEIANIGPYYDGDSFAFHTGPNVSQLTIRGDWPGGDRDFDMFLFQAGSVVEDALAFETGTASDEYITLTVEPDTDYVLWMGLYDGTRPSPYSLTLCSETFSLTGE